MVLDPSPPRPVPIPAAKRTQNRRNLNRLGELRHLRCAEVQTPDAGRPDHPKAYRQEPETAPATPIGASGIGTSDGFRLQGGTRDACRAGIPTLRPGSRSGSLICDRTVASGQHPRLSYRRVRPRVFGVVRGTPCSAQAADLAVRRAVS